MCRFANTEQRHPTGILTNIQGLLRSLVIGWPNLKSIDGELVYLGPLPRVCPCTHKHHESLGTASGSFNSSTSLTMGYSFWHRIFSDFWSKDKFSLRVGGTAVHDVPTASLADAVGSWQPLFEHWKQGKLTRRLLSEYTGSQDVERFLSNARAVCPAHSVRSSLSLRCSSWSSLDRSLQSPLWVTGRTSPGYAYPVGTLPQARHFGPWMYCNWLRGSLRRHFFLRRPHHLLFPRVPHRGRLQVRNHPWPHRGRGDMLLMAMEEVRTWFRVVV